MARGTATASTEHTAATALRAPAPRTASSPGASRSGDVPGWRTFITTSMEDVEILDQTFPGPRSDLRGSSHPMLEIFARA